MQPKIRYKMLSLSYDLLNRVMVLLEPKEIKALYESSTNVKTAVKETIQHTNFVLECKIILSNEEVKWFETNKIKVKLLEECKVDNGNNCYWYKNGKTHRDNDLPAIIYSNGDLKWYKNGKLERDNDLPSIIYSNGSQMWYKNGKLERDNNLPVIIGSTGIQYWLV